MAIFQVKHFPAAITAPLIAKTPPRSGRFFLKDYAYGREIEGRMPNARLANPLFLAEVPAFG